MRLSTLGEFGLIRKIQKLLKVDSSVIKGAGDDCAVVKLDRNTYQLFTCDMIVEGVDFTAQDNPYLIGRKAMAVSLSDIAACAGIPRYALIALGVPAYRTVRFVDEILKGLRDIARRYKVNIVGGDISRSQKLVIDCSVAGVVEKKYLLLRSGAKEKDIIFVTGSFGGTRAGKHLRFTPRLKEARFLSRHCKPSAMIDVSDGLAQDLGHILYASDKGAILYESLIPKSRQARDMEDVLSSGEEFELLFTVSRKKARALYAKKNSCFKPIGEVTDKKYSLTLVRRDGTQGKVIDKGFRHF
ncbi:MAG: thiamine-phosphate kinase [Candidatus Omnitrophota bacterium]|jgi:thiamine-monophosphate kinase|nr:MAG: thiamine-phosphate kinase [Candidatus Omnitrophota bacterium]